MRAGLATGLLWIASLFIAHGTLTVAQAPDAEPAYVVRGRQTEVRQRELKERLERFHQSLSEALRQAAPDLLADLEPPPPIAFGYQILPRVVPDAPPPTPAKPQVVSYSWRWSETLIARQMEAIEQLETDLARVPPSPSVANRAVYEALVAGYKKVVDGRRPVDADIDYNWLWQKQIAENRPLFDRLTSRLEAALARQAQDAARTASPAPEAVAPVSGFDPAAFVRIEQPADHQWLVTVPLYTDITDAEFVEAFRLAIETLWHVRARQDEFRVKLNIEVLSPERLYCTGPATADASVAACAPPAKGAHIDLAAHVARFPKESAVLTTGAASLQLTGRALVLGPHDVGPHGLAHEFGHILGFPDAYLRGYRDLGADGFQVMELVPDLVDIMSSPGFGSVQARHFEGLIVAKDAQTNMLAGLDALYPRNDPVEAVARFRRVLERNPAHYGATLQLAKALDRAGKADEALALWKKMLEIAEAAHDAETLRTVRARLAGGG